MHNSELDRQNMAAFDADGWLRVHTNSYCADKLARKGYRSFNKIAQLTEDDLRQLGLGLYSGELLPAFARLRSQGEEEASRALAQDLPVSVQN